MRFNPLTFLFVIFFVLFFSACEEEEGEDLSLTDLQAQALADENKFKLTSYLNVFSFETNSVTLEQESGYYVISAFGEGASLFIRFPKVQKGTYNGASDPGTYIFYGNNEGRNFYSNFEGLNSDVLINITAVDSAARIFYADFSGLLYDIAAEKPKNRDNQVGVFGGRLNKVAF